MKVGKNWRGKNGVRKGHDSRATVACWLSGLEKDKKWETGTKYELRASGTQTENKMKWRESKPKGCVRERAEKLEQWCQGSCQIIALLGTKSFCCGSSCGCCTRACQPNSNLEACSETKGKACCAPPAKMLFLMAGPWLWPTKELSAWVMPRPQFSWAAANHSCPALNEVPNWQPSHITTPSNKQDEKPLGKLWYDVFSISEL